MSDASERPFEPTPRRIVRARREGNVARAGELAANVSFAAGAVAIVALAPLFGATAVNAIVTSASGTASLTGVAIVVVALAAVAAAALGGALASLMQSGASVVAIVPKFERLNPVAGVARILSRETVAHTVRASLAFGGASLAMIPFVAVHACVFFGDAALPANAAAAWAAAGGAGFAACSVGFAFAIGEYGAARAAWLRRLRMTFEERKREAREEEGDAVTRGRRRALHRTLLRSGMSRLKDASFVLANPRHVAVALEYRPPAVPVPRVVVRAAEEAAIAVRAAAVRCGIPIVENAVLARALYREVRAGEVIPHVHYVAVAEVVAALTRVKELA